MKHSHAHFIFAFLLLPVFSFSQIVKTLTVNEINGPNGFALDASGDLYIANEPGRKVIKLLRDSIAEDVLLSDSPDGLDFDINGDLYIANFYSGIILKKHNITVDTFAVGLNKPADVKWDGKEFIYVSEYETGNIKKIDRNGKITQFVSGFKNPFGLVFDNNSNLYVANNTSGIINKITPDGTVSFFAQIPGAISYLAYSRRSGNLYVCCFTCHNIYIVNGEGNVKLFSGNGIAGYKDGTLYEARFERPNSIIISEQGNIYISEFSANRIRKIVNAEK